ncbi:MAG: type II secretion system protein GspJ [Pseudobdellovibrio sp.]
MRMRSQKAFTLLEVILAITIMSTLALLSTQAITRALKARTKIQTEVDDVASLRDSARMIRADVNLAFHHRDFEQELIDMAQKPAAPAGIAPTPAQPPVQQPSTRTNKREDPTTNFIGAENEMDFVTLNSGRMASAVTQADFIEVGYSLKSCNNLTTGKASNCLYRRTQNIIDDDVKTGGNEIVMLENVSEFKLRYIGETKQDWVSAWNSTTSSSDGGTKGRFPDAVEVSLSIERSVDDKPRTYSMQLVIPVHFPNNGAASTGSGNVINGAAGDGSQPGGVIDQ